MVMAMSASGNVIKRIDHDSFENIMNDTDASLEIFFGFAGGLYDRDTGCIGFGFRHYDPNGGRWTAKDPLGFLRGYDQVGDGETHGAFRSEG